MTENAGGKQGDHESAAASDKAEDLSDDLVSTQHALVTDGSELRYTVTTGRVVLRSEQHTDGTFEGVQARAEVFIAAYTADAVRAACRVRRRQRLTGTAR